MAIYVRYLNQPLSGDPIFYDDGLDAKPEGWYFWDETWSNPSGPYESLKTCRISLAEYENYLNG